MEKNKKYRRHLGPTSQKVLLLLLGGLSLGLAVTPNKYFRVLDQISKEWKAIDERRLRETIRALYESKMVDYKENDGRTLSVILTDNGKRRALTYDLENIKIKIPKKWDGLWRMVVFDIPESEKKARDVLAKKLKQMGFYPMQKSIFIHPFPCKDEVEFISEIFQIKPYVRLIIAKETDIDIHLRKIFRDII